jgi:hypothetical protein
VISISDASSKCNHSHAWPSTYKSGTSHDRDRSKVPSPLMGVINGEIASSILIQRPHRRQPADRDEGICCRCGVVQRPATQRSPPGLKLTPGDSFPGSNQQVPEGLIGLAKANSIPPRFRWTVLLTTCSPLNHGGREARSNALHPLDVSALYAPTGLEPGKIGIAMDYCKVL